jgi:Holliday junction DNA helicase RuvA
MIAQLVGTVTEVRDDRVILAVGGIGYEVLVPAGLINEMHKRLNVPETRLYTLQYLEGNAGMGNMVPRLIGFISPADKEFFELFTSVDGIGNRKALRALAAAPGEIARAVENRDTARLSELPEIGKRTAEKIVAALNGKLGKFAFPGAKAGAPAAPRTALPQFAADALEVLVQLGERPGDGEEMIGRALQAKPELKKTEDLLAEVYRLRAGRR